MVLHEIVDSFGESEDRRLPLLNLSQLIAMKTEERDANHMSEGSASDTVWILLFALILAISAVLNITYIISIVITKNNMTVLRLLISHFFLYNILEYVALILENVSVNGELLLSPSRSVCHLYEILSIAAGYLNTGTLLLLLSFATNSKCGASVASVIKATSLMALMVIVTLGSLAIFPGNEAICPADRTMSIQNTLMEKLSLQRYVYIRFSEAIFAFWLPLVILIPLIGKLMTRQDSEFKKPHEYDLIIVLLLSYGVFNMPKYIILSIRCVLLMNFTEMSISEEWHLQVLSSLSLVISFFWHLFRPSACLLLDQATFPDRHKKMNKYQPVTLCA